MIFSRCNPLLAWFFKHDFETVKMMREKHIRNTVEVAYGLAEPLPGTEVDDLANQSFLLSGYQYRNKICLRCGKKIAKIDERIKYYEDICERKTNGHDDGRKTKAEQMWYGTQ